MPFEISKAVNISAFVCSTILVGLGFAAVYFANDAYNVLMTTFPPGSYGWNPSHWIGDQQGWRIILRYNRSSEIKTYIAAAFSLFIGLSGAFAFGHSFKSPTAPLLSRSLLVSAALACIVAIVCAAWSAVAEVKIKRSTCWFEPAVANYQYYCSIENAACNALRFTDEAWSSDDHARGQENWTKLDRSCLHFRHARYLVIPLAAVSLVLTGLYATRIWLIKAKETENERADTRVRTLQQDN